ncbi:hypothetical protein [Actinomadura mexicana]|uniref:Uncharacterized protein n=1 Tax=Actinomadura mexicana TaxID=134959 RepID=A0A239FB18_9ACTN|nr:hypothetical protein [Actinomadura mexicana]SNS53985.1 hypothetical protein SAMN06265355_12025 [Actinomadura mexicana]
MEHRRPETGTPAAGPLTGERARAAGTAEPGTTDDRHVAGPHPTAPGTQAPETVPDTVPDPVPAHRGTDRTRTPVRDAGAIKTPSQEANQAQPSTRDTDPTGIPVPGTEPEHAASPKPGAAPGAAAGGVKEKLIASGEAERFRERWHEVQAAFVDDPGESVRKADGLASEAVDALAQALAKHRRSLTEALDGGEPADTERLRLALRGYRDLLDRIFAA